MEPIERIKSLLEEEIKNFTLKEQELKELSVEKSLFDEMFAYANTLNDLLDNKERVLMFLKELDEDIYFIMENKINILERIKDKRNKTSENRNIYDDAVASVQKLFLDLQVKYGILNRKIKIYTVSINQNRENVQKYQAILTKLKYHQFIPWPLIQTINELLESRDVDSITQIVMLENLRIYNQTIYEKKHNFKPSYKSNVLDMLTFGFEDFYDDTLDYNLNIEKKVALHYSLLGYQTDFVSYFEDLKKEIPDDNDYKLFIMLMLEKIQKEIHDLIVMIKDIEFYMDDNIRKDIIKNYQQLLSFYRLFRNEYIKTDKKVEEVPQNKVDLIFAKDNYGRPYILKDLKYVNKEYLSEVLKLLKGLQTGSLANRNIETLKHKYAGFKKLKNDQIRIVIKELSPSIYCIIGLGVKKDNTGHILYDPLCSREYPKNKSEYPALIAEGKEIFEKVGLYIEENMRKGKR